MARDGAAEYFVLTWELPAAQIKISVGSYVPRFCVWTFARPLVMLRQMPHMTQDSMTCSNILCWHSAS